MARGLLKKRIPSIGGNALKFRRDYRTDPDVGFGAFPGPELQGARTPVPIMFRRTTTLL